MQGNSKQTTVMPPPTHKTITVPENTFNKFDDEFKVLKKAGKLPPSHESFSAYFSYRMNQIIQEKQKLRNIAEQIKFMPEKFTESKLLVKTNSHSSISKNPVIIIHD